MIGIIAVLTGLLFPALSASRRASIRTACLSNQRQIGVAIFNYSIHFKGAIPYGPKAPPTTATNFYPATGDVTSLISLQNGEPVGLGLMLKDQLAAMPRVLFCPGPDHLEDAEAELAKVGHAQAESGYYYRHGSSVSFSDLVIPPSSAHIRLANLGFNRNARRIRALVMDRNYIADPSLAGFGVITRTNHQKVTVNILFSDGHAITLKNVGGEYSINPGSNPYASFHLILKALETADEQ